LKKAGWRRFGRRGKRAAPWGGTFKEKGLPGAERGTGEGEVTSPEECTRGRMGTCVAKKEKKQQRERERYEAPIPRQRKLPRGGSNRFREGTTSIGHDKMENPR